MGKADLTRLRLLDEAKRLGAVRGFASVSLSDLATATGLSKSAVFKHFGAKGGLELAAVEDLCAEFTACVWEPAASLPAGRARLDEIFSRWLNWVDGDGSDGGCGIIQAQIEFDDQPGPVCDYLRQQQRKWERTLAKEFSALGASDGEQAAFEYRCIVLGYNQAARLSRLPSARTFASRSYDRLIDNWVHSKEMR